MKSKSIKKAMNVVNAYLDMGVLVINATKTYINNPKLVHAIETMDNAILESIEETIKLHGAALEEGYKNIEKAEKESEEETTH